MQTLLVSISHAYNTPTNFQQSIWIHFVSKFFSHFILMSNCRWKLLVCSDFIDGRGRYCICHCIFGLLRSGSWELMYGINILRMFDCHIPIRNWYWNSWLFETRSFTWHFGEGIQSHARRLQRQRRSLEISSDWGEIIAINKSCIWLLDSYRIIWFLVEMLWC